MCCRSRSLICCLLLLLSPVVTLGADAEANAKVLSQLRELKPLPKVHYSWPLPVPRFSDELLYEYVRLTSAASLSVEWSTPEQFERIVLACKKVNATRPKIPATIGMNSSVWHRRFGKKLPPTDFGPTHQAELDYLETRLKTVEAMLSAANKKHDCDIALSAVLFDSERFYVKPDDEKWNRAIDSKYNAASDMVHKYFPKVRIEWYARGAVQPSASPTGWSQVRHFTLRENGTKFGCSLYQVPEIGYTREIFRRTAANAAKHNCQEVTPWIALASGYRRQTDVYHEWSHDWNYDLIYSWKLGREINNSWFGQPVRKERFAPWNKAKIVIFYPQPFGGKTPHWGRHFVAYVRGAHGKKQLPE